MFVQIIEFRTDRRDDLLGLAGRWPTDAIRNGTARSAWLCADRDDPGAWRLIVLFPSHDAAMQNSQRPETDAMSGEFRPVRRRPGVPQPRRRPLRGIVRGSSSATTDTPGISVSGDEQLLEAAGRGAG